ncbi:MAG: cytochrome c biogenesis protein ResB [Candidatus Omnitrophica bacterium]|nr:cytochrome c biogenesis protein ResB [Candidatus Omnitrophota bacterium]
MMKWMNQVFKFFGSLKLAVTLIVILGIAFGVGTFIEADHGTHAAQVLVYRTTWMSVLMALLALNLLASALDRIPWKKKHVGFLTTHLGIILMLLGALVTQGFGIEGQLQIREGEQEGRMSLAGPLIQVVSIDSGGRWTFLPEQHVFPWTGRKLLDAGDRTPFRLSMLADYPKAKFQEEIVEGESGSPALHVTLKGSMASSDQWLVLDDASRSSYNLGPAAIRFTAERILPETKKTGSGFGTLRFDFESGTHIEIPLESNSQGRTYPLEGTPFQVEVKQIFKDAVVNQNQLMERSEEWQNPAVQLILKGAEISEQHTVFAQFPDFPTIHGLKPSEAHVRIAYEVPQFAEQTSQNEIRFIAKPKGLPDFQVKSKQGLMEGAVRLGEDVSTGWMDFKFSVDRYLERAKIKTEYMPLPNVSKDEEARSVMQLELETAGSKQAVWLSQGEVAHVSVGGSDYHVIYGLRTVPIGFQVALRDFMMDTDPGTNRPASFKSEVTLQDPSRGIEQDVLIQMNEPLKHKGFKVYQSAYHLEPGKPDISIFTVAKDPGNPLKYAGAIILVSGILMLFYVKPFSTLKTSDPKLRSR